eukprot:418888_1
MQNDGNLVMYDSSNNQVWASNTANSNVAALTGPVYKSIGISIIHFCISSKVRYGEVEFNTYSDLTVAPYFRIFSQTVIYDHGPFKGCTSVRIMVGFSGFQMGTCNLALWTENESGDGFTLYLGIWSTNEDNTANMPTQLLDCARNKGETDPYESPYWKSYVMAQYFATCRTM